MIKIINNYIDMCSFIYESDLFFFFKKTDDLYIDLTYNLKGIYKKKIINDEKNFILSKLTAYLREKKLNKIINI